MGAPLAAGAFPDLISAIGKKPGSIPNPFDFGGLKPGTRPMPGDRGGPGYIGPPDTIGGPGVTDTPTGGRAPLTFGGMADPGNLPDALARIGQPPSPSDLIGFAEGIPGVPNAPSPTDLTNFLPGANQLPGVEGFSSLLGNMLGFGGGDNGYGGMSQQDWLSSVIPNAPPGTVNPYQNMLQNLFGGLEGRGAYSG